MNASTLHLQKSNLPRPFRDRDIINRQTSAPVACAAGIRRADLLPEGAFVVGPLVGKLCRGKHVLGMNHQEQVVLRLEMNIPSVRRRRDIIDGMRITRIAHVEN